TPQNLNIAGIGTGNVITTTKTGSKFTGNFIDWSSMVDPNAYKDPEVKNALLEMKKRHPNGQLADPKLQQMINDVSQIGQGINAKLNQGYSDLFNELYKHYGYDITKTDPDGTVRRVRALDRNGESIYRNQILELNKIKDMLAPISMPGWTRNIATPEDLVAIDKLRNYEEQQKNSSFGLKLNYYTPDQLESYLNNLKGAYSQLNNIDFKALAQALGSSANVLRGDNPYNPSQSGGATDFGLHTIQLAPAVVKMPQFQMPQFEEPKPQTLETSASNVTTTKTPRGGGGGGSKPHRTVNYPTADKNGSFSAVADTKEASTATTIPNLVNMVVTAVDNDPKRLQSASLAEAHWAGLKSKMADNTLSVTIPNKKNKQYTIDQTKSNYADIITQIVAEVSTIPKTNSKDKVVNLCGYELISGNVNGELKILGVAKKDKNGKMGKLYSMGEVYALMVPDLDNIGDLQIQMKKLIENIYNQIQIPDKDVISTTILDPYINHSWSDATLKQSLGPDLFFGSKVASQSEIDGINSGKIQWAQHK
ncbi:MAG TPA: hypothetical protein P5545_00845, partial [Bacteroidota bacterium]|nr:hypothetical protein [Bacteroidota bacterium]